MQWLRAIRFTAGQTDQSNLFNGKRGVNLSCKIYIHLFFTSIFMNIPDNGITPALFWIIPEVDLPLEWYLGWNRTHPASNYNRLGVWARFGFIKQWTERKENAKLDFFSNIYIKSSQDRISFQGLTVTEWKERQIARIWNTKGKMKCFFLCRQICLSFYFVYIYCIYNYTV